MHTFVNVVVLLLFLLIFVIFIFFFVLLFFIVVFVHNLFLLLDFYIVVHLALLRIYISVRACYHYIYTGIIGLCGIAPTMIIVIVIVVVVVVLKQSVARLPIWHICVLAAGSSGS